MKIKTFTLSEVLITILIIGVIAAITVPVIVNFYNKKETVTRLKKVYSEVKQAAMLSQVQYGSYENWDYKLSAPEFFAKYLEPNLKVASKIGVQEAKNNLGVNYAGLSGEDISLYSPFRDTATIVTLTSGAQIFVRGDEWKSFYSAVDINGFKKPNKMGKDLFVFMIYPKLGGIIMMNVYDNEITDTLGDELLHIKRGREELINGSGAQKYPCNKDNLGMFCGALIQIDNWEIKDDYPW